MASYTRHAPYRKPITRRDKKKILESFSTKMFIVEERDDPCLGYYIKIKGPDYLGGEFNWIHQWFSYNGSDWSPELIESKSTIYRRIRKARKAVMDNNHAFSLDEMEKAVAVMDSMK